MWMKVRESTNQILEVSFPPIGGLDWQFGCYGGVLYPILDEFNLVDVGRGEKFKF